MACVIPGAGYAPHQRDRRENHEPDHRIGGGPNYPVRQNGLQPPVACGPERDDFGALQFGSARAAVDASTHNPGGAHEAVTAGPTDVRAWRLTAANTALHFGTVRASGAEPRRLSSVDPIRVCAAEMQVRPAERQRAGNRSATPCLARSSSIWSAPRPTTTKAQERRPSPSGAAAREAGVPGMVEGRPTQFSSGEHRSALYPCGERGRRVTVSLALTRSQGWMTSAPFKTASKCPRTGVPTGSTLCFAGVRSAELSSGGVPTIHQPRSLLMPAGIVWGVTRSSCSPSRSGSCSPLRSVGGKEDCATSFPTPASDDQCQAAQASSETLIPDSDDRLGRAWGAL